MLGELDPPKREPLVVAVTNSCKLCNGASHVLSENMYLPIYKRWEVSKVCMRIYIYIHMYIYICALMHM